MAGKVNGEDWGFVGWCGTSFWRILHRSPSSIARICRDACATGQKRMKRPHCITFPPVKCGTTQVESSVRKCERHPTCRLVVVKGKFAISKRNLRATGRDESSSRGRAGDTTTLRNAKFQLASH